jgi:hypothetical protein
MDLRPPFIIGARLLPALRIGDAVLNLESTALANCRTRATFVLDIGDQTCRIDDLYSGMNGYRSVVEPFAVMLSFMGACAEAFRARANPGENADLFTPFVAQWCADHANDIDSAQCALTDGDGRILHHLIEV